MAKTGIMFAVLQAKTSFQKERSVVAVLPHELLTATMFILLSTFQETILWKPFLIIVVVVEQPDPPKILTVATLAPGATPISSVKGPRPSLSNIVPVVCVP
jgi:hypothetical protein